MNTPTPQRMHSVLFVILSIFLIGGLAFPAAAGTWVKVGVKKEDKARHITDFYYPSDGLQAKGTATTLYLTVATSKKANSQLAIDEKGEKLIWAPEAGDTAKEPLELRSPEGYTKETFTIGGGGQMSPVIKDGKYVWKKVTHEGKTYYYPDLPGNAEWSVRGANHYGIDLYSQPKLEAQYKLNTHLQHLPGGKLDLHVLPEGIPADKANMQKGTVVPNGKYTMEEELIAESPFPEIGSGYRPGEVPNPGDGQGIGNDPNNPINQISGAIGKDYEARLPDIVKRIMEFTWPPTLPEGRKSFITPEVAPNAGIRDNGFKAALTTWASAAENRVGVVTLYYGLGAGANPPEWVKTNPKLFDLLANPEKRQGKLLVFEKLLAGCLDRWAVGTAGERAAYCSKLSDATPQTRTPLASDKVPEWTAAFHKDAGAEATAILGSSIPQDVLEGLIGGHNQPPTVPGDNTNGQNNNQGQFPSMTGAFGVDRLFGKYGDPNVFMLDGRKMALVLRTRREFEGKPPQAVMKQQIGVYDISNESEIYGKRFDIGSSGEYSFALKPGGKNYTLKLTPDGADTRVALVRSNGKTPEFGDPSQKDLMTVNQMFRYRAEQVMTQGQRTVVNGKTYYVSGESSDKGALLFWSEDMLKAAQNKAGDPRSYNPEMLAYVNQKVGGMTQNLAGQVHLGQVNGKWMDLKYNDKTGIWESVEGTAPEVVQPKTETGTGSTDPKTGTGSTDPQTGNGSTDPGNGNTTAPAQGLKLTDGRNFKPDGANAARLNSKLSDALKGKVRFLENTENTAAGQGIIMMANNSLTEFDFLPYAEMGGETLVVLGQDIMPKDMGLEAGRYLVTASNHGFTFVDLNGLKLPGRDNVMGTYKPNGKGNAVDKVKDEAVLKHILVKQAGYPEAEAEKALANLKAVRKDRKWEVSGIKYGEAKVWLVGVFKAANSGEGARGAVIYPTAGEEDLLDNILKNLVVPAGKGILFTDVNAQDKDNPLGGFTGFDDAPANFQPAGTWKKVKEENGAAIYKVSRSDEADQYFVQVKITVGGKDPKTRNPFLVFDTQADEKKRKRIPLPGGDLAKVGVSGLDLSRALSSNATFKPKAVSADFEAKGFWAAYDAPEGKSANCVGVLVWWGQSHKEACESCGAVFKDGACREK